MRLRAGWFRHRYRRWHDPGLAEGVGAHAFVQLRAHAFHAEATCFAGLPATPCQVFVPFSRSPCTSFGAVRLWGGGYGKGPWTGSPAPRPAHDHAPRTAVATSWCDLSTGTCLCESVAACSVAGPAMRQCACRTASALPPATVTVMAVTFLFAEPLCASWCRGPLSPFHGLPRTCAYCARLADSVPRTDTCHGEVPDWLVQKQHVAL